MKKNKSLGNFYQKYGIFVIMVAAFVIASFASKDFMTGSNLTNVLKQISPIAIVAAGETIMLVTGQIDLSASAVIALASCVGASALQATVSVFMCFIVAIAVAVVVNYFSGVLITKLRLPAFVATLATMNMCKGLAYIYTVGAVTADDNLKWLNNGKLFGVIPWLVIVMFIVLIIMQVLLKRTKLGLYMYAVGGNNEASIAAGINSNRIIRVTYIINGVLVGVASVVLTARMMSATPNFSGGSYEFDAITATVVGGTSFTGGFGSMFNVIIGAIIVGIINNCMILMGVNSNWQIVVKGILIAAAVAIDINTKKKDK